MAHVTYSDDAVPAHLTPPQLLGGKLTESWLRRMKFAYTARRARRHPLGGLIVGETKPEPGDVVLARVDELGHHKRLELKTGRRAHLFPGDEIVVCYGSRYAPDQFEAEIPDDLSPCHLVAAGGIASRMLSRHVNISEPTQITPVGLFAKETGDRLNVADFALEPPPPMKERPLSIAVIGSAMNSGKTTTAGNLVKGLVGSRRRVGAAKVTGTGAGGDVWFLSDSGANPVLDFTSIGLASTYRAGSSAVERAFTDLYGHVAASGVDALVLEVADGVYQCETAELLRSRAFVDRVDGVVFAAADALSAAAAVDHVRDLDLPLVAISGRVTASPLAAREARDATDLPVVDMEDLRNPAELLSLLPRRPQPVAGLSLAAAAAALLGH